MKKLAFLLSTGALAVGVAAFGGLGSHASPAAAHTLSSTTRHASGPGSASVRAHATVSKLSISAALSGKLMYSTESLRAKAGKVIITFTNHAPEAHNLTVIHGTRGSKVGGTPTFKGGSRTLTLHLKAGRYTYYCSVPGHRQGGMQGTLTVR